MRYTPTPTNAEHLRVAVPGGDGGRTAGRGGRGAAGQGAAAAAGPATVAGTSVPSANAAVVRRIAGRFMVAPSVMGLLPS